MRSAARRARALRTGVQFGSAVWRSRDASTPHSPPLADLMSHYGALASPGRAEQATGQAAARATTASGTEQGARRPGALP